MYSDLHDILTLREQQLRPDRRQAPRDSDIRLRIKRLTRVYL